MIRVERVTGAGLAEWNDILLALDNHHILQTLEWGQFKGQYGWQPRHYLWRDERGDPAAAALVLERAAPGGFKILYVPRGPVFNSENQTSLLPSAAADLERLARERGVIFIKMDPELVLGWGVPGTEGARESEQGNETLRALEKRGWRLSDDQVQFKNTVQISLAGTADEWLTRMKQKTRYNIRLAERKGVVVRAGGEADLPALYRMYAETSIRDGFVIRSEAYYTALWKLFIERGMAEPLIAEVEGDPVGAVILFHLGERAWYLYGMSREAHREKMPNYLLQFEAMRRAKTLGCAWYDLWGAPDVFDESDSMWGVFRFKEGLGGEVVRTAGAWDYSARPWLFRLYTRVLPRILDWMRRRGKAKTKSEVEQRAL